MKRLEELLKYIDRSSLGIEVAPYFNPALPKIQGNRVLILDVFDTEALRSYAAKDPLIPSKRLMEIEDVDIVGDASSIADMLATKELSGQIGFVISSHNFEHLPNPIKFLRGCSAILKPGGMLSMAVPDNRACFDHFRMPTRLSEWLAAYHGNFMQPSAEAIFDLAANESRFMVGGMPYPSCNIARDAAEDFVLTGDLTKAYADYLERLKGPFAYFDTHCTIMFPQTLELMLRDLRHLGLCDLEIVEVSATYGHEFFVHLRKPLVVASDATPNSDYKLKRAELLRTISENLGAAPYIARPFTRGLVKKLLAKVVGKQRYNKLRNANRDRHARNRAARENSQ